MVADTMKKDPNIESFLFSVGSSNWGSSGSNQSRMYVQLVPRRQRALKTPQSFGRKELTALRQS